MTIHRRARTRAVSAVPPEIRAYWRRAHLNLRARTDLAMHSGHADETRRMNEAIRPRREATTDAERMAPLLEAWWRRAR